MTGPLHISVGGHARHLDLSDEISFQKRADLKASSIGVESKPHFAKIYHYSMDSQYNNNCTGWSKLNTINQFGGPDTLANGISVRNLAPCHLKYNKKW